MNKCLLIQDTPMRCNSCRYVHMEREGMELYERWYCAVGSKKKINIDRRDRPKHCPLVSIANENELIALMKSWEP